MKMFKHELTNRRLLLGTVLSLPSPETAEILANAGFDWLFIDAEHSSLGSSELQAIIGRVDHKVPCVVRVAAAEEWHIKKALDIGATGIIVPQVNSAKTAERIVQFSKYPPEGARGVGIGRAHGYGASFSDYLKTANERVAVIIQIEHIDAVHNIEKIVQVKGIDAVFVGPYDLSASMNRLGEVKHPEVRRAIDHVTSVCQKTGMPLGIFCLEPESAHHYIEQGYSLLAVGIDSVLLANAGRKICNEIKNKFGDFPS